MIDKKCPFRQVRGFIVLISLTAMFGTAQAASFDCAKAKARVEKLVCSHADLSKLDDKLQDAYHEQFVQANDKRIVRALQRYWLKHVRNACKTVQCVSFAYKERILALQHYPVYFFTLTQGKGMPVCEAYLKRLNTADFATPPYCNIPEQTSIPGFAPLHRVPLTAKEIAVFGLHILVFDETGRQGNKKEIANLMAQWNMTPESYLKSVEKQLNNGGRTWRYGPPVDVDNDGRPDNVVVQPDLGCGHAEQTSHYETDGRKPIRAYILVASNDRLDIPKTKAIFGYPNGKYPIGPTIGIFKYQNLYYIDTFLFDGPLNQWGFLPYTRSESRQVNTLAVFLRRHGKTKRMCEYHMTQTE